MRLLTVIAVAMFVLCGMGCDGVYIYSYRGQLLHESDKTPAANVRVIVNAADKPSMADRNDAEATVTDQKGQFQGSFVRGTGWVTMFRPDAPKLDRVYLHVESADPIPVALSGSSQTPTNAGMKIELPATVIPQPPSTMPSRLSK